jgi:nuclear transport factor 2 (NTF2) superfamily protein
VLRPFTCTSAIGIATIDLQTSAWSPPCLRALPCRHSRPRPPRRRPVWRRMPGTAATRNVWRSLTPRTVPGEIESNSSRDGPAIIAFLERKWARELDYRLLKEVWGFRENRTAVRFAYEWRDDSGHWFRSHGNENWEFDAEGQMRRRIASINDLPIAETDRKFRWRGGRRRDVHPGLSELGLWRLGKSLAWTEKDCRGANDEARRPDGKDSRHEAREGLELETHLRRDRRHGADVDRRRAARPEENS